MGVEPKGFPKAPMQARHFSKGAKAMTLKLICGAAAFVLASAFVPAAAQIQMERIPEGHVQSPDADEVPPAAPAKVHPFAMLAGTWTGGGKIDLTNDIHEKLRCRATYTYNQASSGLALAIVAVLLIGAARGRRARPDATRRWLKTRSGSRYCELQPCSFQSSSSSASTGASPGAAAAMGRPNASA